MILDARAFRYVTLEASASILLLQNGFSIQRLRDIAFASPWPISLRGSGTISLKRLQVGGRTHGVMYGSARGQMESLR